MDKKVLYKPSKKRLTFDRQGEEEALNKEFERMKKEHKAQAEKKKGQKK